MKISMIVAVARNGVIGKNNNMPWTLPSDLKYFKAMTQNHTVIMGRKTFQSIGKPLSYRQNIILSRDKNFKYEGIVVVSTPEEALKSVNEGNECIVIGGGEIYPLFLDKSQMLYLTYVLDNPEGDTTLSLGGYRRGDSPLNDRLESFLSMIGLNMREWKIVYMSDKIQEERDSCAYQHLKIQREIVPFGCD